MEQSIQILDQIANRLLKGKKSVLSGGPADYVLDQPKNSQSKDVVEESPQRPSNV